MYVVSTLHAIFYVVLSNVKAGGTAAAAHRRSGL